MLLLKWSVTYIELSALWLSLTENKWSLHERNNGLSIFAIECYKYNVMQFIFNKMQIDIYTIIDKSFDYMFGHSTAPVSLN